MKKQRIQLIVLAVLLLICLGGYFLLRRTDFSEKGPEAVSVLGIEADAEITSMALSGSTAWRFEKKDGNWTDAQDASRKLSQTQVGALTEYLSHMEAKEVIDAPKELSAYGLTEPAGTVEIGLADGGSRTLIIGSRNELTQDYYVRNGAADTVYTVNSYEAEAFLKEAEAFLDTEAVSENTVTENISGNTPSGNTATDGTASERAATDGTASEGAATDGTASEGAATDGTASGGAATGGTASGGDVS